MHTFSRYDQLLTKYLLNELDAAEEEELLLWLEASEENRSYLEKFAAVWNLSSAPETIRRIDVDLEWEKHRMDMDHSGTIIRMQNYLPDSHTPGSQQTGRYGSTPFPKYKKWWKIPAVAAACAVVAIALYLEKTGNRKSEAGPAEVIVRSGPRPLASGLQTVTNRSSLARTLALNDGSAVVLYPNSELTYDSLFPGGIREFLLRGKADFNVAKAKSKPFIVTHGDLATLVLGTRFTIWAPAKGKTQRIRLYEGKVMIRAADTLSKLRGSYYLSPGQEFVYDGRNSTGLVKAFDKLPTPTVAAAGSKEEITLPDRSKGSWLMINNQPLPEVFDELQSVYNVPIVYKASDVNKMYFIGKFDSSDSLDVILSRMATLYHLKITRRPDKYIISK